MLGIICGFMILACLLLMISSSTMVGIDVTFQVDPLVDFFFFFLISNENFIKQRKTANPSTLGMD